eukprot:CAMPEP_0115350666 /NCGR_PEP_ID=MMETSP0270-20121206/96586_1 /TAXON_ID=71861 /ORGANISM="Scrippsiella trochoidea, Strain CCMP3099" /LENGTH=255 /DNA_ID=CAMNT_0002772771 /DNA_START=111 /DNA_END=878 /DNA_ORIENTATION=-
MNMGERIAGNNLLALMQKALSCFTRVASLETYLQNVREMGCFCAGMVAEGCRQCSCLCACNSRELFEDFFHQLQKMQTLSQHPEARELSGGFVEEKYATATIQRSGRVVLDFKTPGLHPEAVERLPWAHYNLAAPVTPTLRRLEASAKELQSCTPPLPFARQRKQIPMPCSLALQRKAPEGRAPAGMPYYGNSAASANHAKTTDCSQLSSNLRGPGRVAFEEVAAATAAALTTGYTGLVKIPHTPEPIGPRPRAI